MPTVFEAVGGIDALRRLAGAWHRRVMADKVVAHAFSHGFHRSMSSVSPRIAVISVCGPPARKLERFTG
jgi:hemoglobin